ncbi:protein kinase [Stieleria sp. ICT_E10.1]|uniref:serine/threonine-protein kinase n=1 Tax=Stieleria sedimenti TaxID=2976331 RepID=UPI00218019AC|nr:serine/threonine-protein kinase [Stieleria sedimenti]MCS7468926.1 protein kinase [Stieleria sedimenti]
MMNQPEDQPTSDLNDPLFTVDPLESFDPDLTTDQPSGGTPDDVLDQTIDSGDALKRADSKQPRPPSNGSSDKTDKKLDVESATVRSGKGKQADVAARHGNDSNARYRATEMHARGGLGAVFRARDKELKRIVALKEILPEHSDNPHYQEKFVFEAEVTGSLEHPGIVPVYGLGRYQDNQPYYAMRFIRGESFSAVIRAFHQANPDPSPDVYLGREFRSLLRRLTDACNAIHFAHEHGVLHRDIKPANIMLGQYGETLVVDWGLAKLMGQFHPVSIAGDHSTIIGIGGSNSSKTRLGTVVGTPMFMSPEQALGDSELLDGRTDIYSLGAVLFQLITGERPVEGKTSLDVIRNVREGKIRRVTQTNPAAPRALESICEKAMSHNPDDRYAKATELADDIDRWLNDELALAHAPNETVLERTGRLIRRYRSWTISGAASLLLITAIAIVSVLLVNHARKAEQIAKLQAKEAHDDAVARYQDSRAAIDTWLVQSSDALQYFPGSQAVRKRLLQRAIEDYERLAEHESSDPQLELERGRAMVRVGDLMQMQQDFEASETSYTAAEKIFQAGTQGNDHTLAFQCELAGVHVRRGSGLAEQNRILDAEKEFSAAVDQLKQLAGRTSNPLPWRSLAAAHLNAGQLFAELDPERSLQHLTNGLAAYEKIETAGDPEIRLGIAVANDTLGQILRDQGQHDAATERFAISVRMLGELVNDQPDRPEYLQALASVFVSKASSFRTRGLQRKLFETLETAVEYYRALVQSLPGVPRHSSNLAITLIDLALAKHEAGLNREAETLLEEAYQIISALVTTYGNSPRMVETLALCNDVRGQVFLDLKEQPGDDAAMAENLLLQLTRTGETDDEIMRLFERLAIVQSHLAQVLQRTGQPDLAADRFDQSVSRLNSLIEIRGQAPRLVNALAHVHFRYALLLDARDDAQANSHFVKARELWLGMKDDLAASYAHDFAWMLAICPDDSVRDLSAAERWAGRAVESAPENPEFHTTAALVAAMDGRADRAIEGFEKSQQLRGSRIDRDLYGLAIAWHANGDIEQARQLFGDATAWQDSERPYDHDLTRLRRWVETKLGTEEE